MSVTSVLIDRPTSYRPIPGNNAPTAKFAAPAKPSQATPTPQAADPTDASQLQSAWARARVDGATASGSTSGTSEPDGRQSSSGIALYKRISQIGNSEPSASELLKSWNSIMQSGQDADEHGAGVLQALLRTGAPPFGSDILDVTA
jgi:hypothetical protein